VWWIDEWIEKAKTIHGNKYDYSIVDYNGSYQNVSIICSIHGVFTQKAYKHLSGRGCQKCVNKYRPTTDEWVERAKNVHGDKYDYSKTIYVNARKKVLIICSEHGEFWQTPYDHLNGCGCLSCSGKNMLTIDEFIKIANKTHGCKYDYSNVKYNNSQQKVSIICPKHGEFLQIPVHHLRGSGCPKCAGKNLTTEEWVVKVKDVHKNKYDYSKTKYVNVKTKICIVCSKHGEFWKTPSEHLSGQGCPNCNSSKMENIVVRFLETRGVLHERRYRGFEWLKNEKKLELDFYLPEHNIAIECQGVQHFKPIDCWGGDKSLDYIQKNDKLKKRLCDDYNIPLYYINYNDNIEEKLNDIFTNILK